MSGSPSPPQDTNAYCERLGIAVPSVDDAIDRADAVYGTPPKLLHLMVVALLEHGGPMAVEDIATRVEDAGAVAPTGDMELSLKKAWHGLAPVIRDADGRFALDLGSSELDLLAFRLGLRPPRYVTSPGPEPEPELVPPPDDVPLTIAELDGALRARSVWSLSVVRQAAAVLDGNGGRLTIEEVESVLADLTEHRSKLPTDPKRWARGLVVLDDDGRLRLESDPPAREAMRRAIRKLAYPELNRRRRSLHTGRVIELRRREREEQRRRDEESSASRRRAVIRVLPTKGKPHALAVLDVGARSIRTMTGGELDEAEAVLGDFDVVAGLHVRDELRRLELEPDRWRLADLKPPKKTKTLNKAGRKLTITPELLISNTTGISRPLGDPKKIGQYIETGDEGKLRRRIESDVKALFAFYSYGVLHNYVRLRWGFLDERLGVQWALPGDPSLHRILERAQKDGRAVELVTRTAPGWSDPWSRGWRVEVHELDPWTVWVDDGSEVIPIEKCEIQTARVVGILDPGMRTEDD